MEEKLTTTEKKTKELKTINADLTEENNTLKVEATKLKSASSSADEVSAKVKSVEAHNAQLQNSLFEIAQVVLDDADKEENELALGPAAETTPSGTGLISSSMVSITPLKANLTFVTSTPLLRRTTSRPHVRMGAGCV